MTVHRYDDPVAYGTDDLDRPARQTWDVGTHITFLATSLGLIVSVDGTSKIPCRIATGTV